jgi:adenylate cyclase
MKKIIKNPSEIELKPSKREITASFTNMTGYVGIAEKMPLEVLPVFMNKYFELNSDEILRADGVIDKFEGDKILAFWSILETERHSAQLACETSLAQMNAMNRFYNWAKNHGHPCPKIRIGISTGELIVGNLGIKNRMDFTVMGHSVNVAHTLQEMAKEHGFDILVSETTRDMTNGLKFGHAIPVDCCDSKINAYPLLK